MRVANKRIHVNQHNIKYNCKRERDERLKTNYPALPVLTTKFKGKTYKSNRADIKDKEGNILATVIYSPDKPLSCGAKVWIETKMEVKLDETSI